MKKIVCTIMTASFIVAICGCNNSSTTPTDNSTPSEQKTNTQEPQQPAANPDSLEIIGTIVYNDIEGGFFAINGDDGTKYDPLNLPESFKKDGLKIKATAHHEKDVMSTHMYGDIISIEDINEL